MKKNIFFALLMTGCLSAEAQTAEKRVKLSDTTQLVYAVTDNGSKEGVYYIKNLKNDGLWLQGNYKNDNRIGIWYFFNAKNKLTLRYNYDQKKLAYIDESALKNVSVDVMSKDPDVKKNASAPLPLCPIDYYVSIIKRKIYASGDTEFNGLDAEITAHVNTEGKATYTVSYMGSNSKLVNQKVDVKDDKFQIDWIPSKYKNQPIDSEFTVYTSVKANNANGFRRNRWNN